MRCTNCGAANADDARVCVSCQLPLSGVGQAPGSRRETVSAVGANEIVYGSFWQRLAALIVDGFVVLGIQIATGSALAVALIAGETLADKVSMSAERLDWLELGIRGLGGLAQLLAIVGYFVLMESGERGATLGKRVLKLRVVDATGERVSKQRALGRCLARLLSTLPVFLGYLMQPYTRHKQALHDMVAGTLVVQTEKSDSRLAAAIILITLSVTAVAVGAAVWGLLALVGAANMHD
jgi:uncharacterized RDD family membrane protein YckC